MTPEALEDLERRLERLALDHVDVPLDDVLEARVGGCQRGFEIAEDLLCLGDDVAVADDLAGGGDGVLPAHIDRLGGPGSRPRRW